MARKSRTLSKADFNANDFPTESQFAALIDAAYHDAYNVRDYGAVGDGTTNDLPAFQAAQTDMPAEGGVLRIPQGDYKITATFTQTKPMTIIGDGKMNVYPSTITAPLDHMSRIRYAGPANTPAISATNSSFHAEKIGILNVTGSPAVGHCGIKIDACHDFCLRDINIMNFYDGLQVYSGSPEYNIDNVKIFGPTRHGMYLNQVVNYDWGDQCISNCTVRASGKNMSSGIFAESGGGIKIINFKTNDTGDGFFMNQGIYWNNIYGSTCDILICNCSLEGLGGGGPAIKITSAALLLHQILINNIQIAWYNTGLFTPGIDIEGNIKGVAICNVQAFMQNGTAQPMIRLTGVEDGRICNLVNQTGDFGGFATLVDLVGCTNVLQAQYA